MLTQDSAQTRPYSQTRIKASSSTTEYLPKGNKNTNSKRYMHPYVHCGLIHKNQDMKATQGNTADKGVDKDVVIHTMEYFTAIKK